MKEISWAEKPCKDHGMRADYGYADAPRSIRGSDERKRLHVITCEMQNGPRPEGHEASHLCHNKRCWEPTHMIWETSSENKLRDPEGKRSTAAKLWQSKVPAEIKSVRMSRMGSHSWSSLSPEKRKIRETRALITKRKNLAKGKTDA